MSGPKLCVSTTFAVSKALLSLKGKERVDCGSCHDMNDDEFSPAGEQSSQHFLCWFCIFLLFCPFVGNVRISIDKSVAMWCTINDQQSANGVHAILCGRRRVTLLGWLLVHPLPYLFNPPLLPQWSHHHQPHA